MLVYPGEEAGLVLRGVRPMKEALAFLDHHTFVDHSIVGVIVVAGGGGRGYVVVVGGVAEVGVGVVVR